MSMNAAPARMPAGPKLQLEVTEAITNAFFEELADVGYGRLSIDAVARRAGVGKAAIYRRGEFQHHLTPAPSSEGAGAVKEKCQRHTTFYHHMKKHNHGHAA